MPGAKLRDVDASADGAGGGSIRRDRRRSLAELASVDVGGNRISGVVVTGTVRTVELGLVCLCGFIAHQAIAAAGAGWLWIDSALVPVVAIAHVLVAQSSGLYSVPIFRRRAQQAVRLLAAWSGVMALLALVAIAVTGLDAKAALGWCALWWGLGLVVLGVERVVVFALVRHWTRSGRLMRRTAVVGGGPAGAELIELLAVDRTSDVVLVGVFDDRTDERTPDFVAGLPKLGTVDDLVEFARRTRIDLIIFTLPITAEARILDMMKRLEVLPVDIRLSAHSNQLQLRPRSYSYLGSVPMIDVLDRPIADWDIIAKALFDRGVGWLLLILLSPLMLGTALVIKATSKGPAFFRQKRYGFNNELIEVFKFRSMYVDQCDSTASKLVTKGDPRVTPVGRFIRKTSIDELPQLFNVAIKGNLSLVGPRPHALHASAENRLYNEVVDGYFARHRVKPGITGWAQINGWRGETDTAEKIQQRVAHDLYYIENWSVMLDVAILVRTPLSLMTKTEGAY
jgi:Undecaprenyl-phosphate glucose phosphotransferase